MSGKPYVFVSLLHLDAFLLNPLLLACHLLNPKLIGIHLHTTLPVTVKPETVHLIKKRTFTDTKRSRQVQLMKPKI